MGSFITCSNPHPAAIDTAIVSRISPLHRHLPHTFAPHIFGSTATPQAMRAVTVVVALVAGTAVRLLISALPPFRQRRLARRAAREASSTQTSRASSPPRRSRPPSAKRGRLGEVAQLLDVRAPCVRGDIWARAHARRETTECTFCLDVIRPSRSVPVRETPCGHSFHAGCLERWVFYTADICLDWSQYSLADDGAIDAHVRLPTCPNCAADLGVIPEKLVRQVLLTSVARSLSLRDLAAAEEMYDAGLVYRASTTQAESVAGPSSVPVRTASSVPVRPVARREEAVSVPAPLPPAPTVRRAFAVRRDSTASEPYLPALAFVAHTEHVVHAMSRRSLPDDFVAPRTGHRVGSAEERGLRRRRARRRVGELAPTARVVLQASS